MNGSDYAAGNAIRVGLSTTMMEPSLTQGRLDGIGVYTNALRHNLPQAGCAVQGFSFPRSAVSSAQSSLFTAGAPMPHSYELSSLIDLATPGAHRCHMPMDLFHVTDYRIVRMDCPVVATLHDAVPIKYPHWCTPRLRGLKNWLQKKAAKKADHVIALSHYAVTELVECFGIDPRRISVVYCGVGAAWELPQPAAAVAATLAACGLRAGYFLFVGTLQPRKNVERILQAYLALPPGRRALHQLVIVGRAGWQCDDLIRQLTAAQQNGENVVWLSQLTDEAQLRHVYAAAAVFVFPSLYEGFGIPVLEAFSSGVPVVTSNTTSLPEVSQGAALEVDPTSVAQIGAAMLTLVQDEACRARCIAAGRQRVAQLTWRQTALQTVAVYRSLLSS
jgi:glycosyltransferase involved in cell wall biosynthesis